MPEFRGIPFELSEQAHPVTPAEIQVAETALGCVFPSAYRDFILEFGAGEFLELTLRASPPSVITHNAASWQASYREYWFWHESTAIWSQQQACESFGCFDGVGGDNIRFHPSDPETMYLLPYSEECIYRMTTFAELISWFARNASYDLSSRPLVFEPWYPSTA